MSADFTLQALPVRRLLLGLVVIVLLALVFPTALKVIFAADDEISYDVSLSLSTCVGFLADETGGGETCVASYSLTLGNTGTNPQDLVLVHLAAVPPTFRVYYNVVDIVASAQRYPQPVINWESNDDKVEFVIGPLYPNRQVEIDLRVLGRDAARQLENIAVEIEAEGSVIRTSPRLTVVSRLVRNVFSIFGV